LRATPFKALPTSLTETLCLQAQGRAKVAAKLANLPYD
jgi:hypothetical protein